MFNLKEWGEYNVNDRKTTARLNLGNGQIWY